MVQLNVWTGTKWVNIFDGNDFTNTQADLHRVAKVVETHTSEIQNATNTASDAVKAVDSAVSASKVNSDAIAVQSSAISEAKIALNSAIAEIQQTASNAASDAANIRADVAKVESEVASANSANQDSVNALQSDIDTTKKDLAGVQSGLSSVQAAIGQNQELINDSVAKINNDIAQDRADIEATQQANSDTATQLSNYAKQAADQGNTIKILQDDDSSTKATIADINGNVSQVQDSVSGLSASLKDTQGNLATVKSLADSLNATITDQGKNITSLQATAQSLSSTLSDADGRLSKVEQTAEEQSTTIGNLRSEVEWEQVSNSSLDTMKSAGHFWGTGASFAGKPGNINDTDQVRVVVEAPSDNSISQVLYANDTVWQRSFNGNTWSEWVRGANQSDVDTLQGSITQVKQTADGLTDTLKDAQGDIASVQATAKGLSEQVTNAQGAITDLQTDVTGIKATIADNENDIHTLQADSKTLKDNMADANGNISSLQKTSTSLTSEMQDHDGRLSKVEQTASTLTNEFSDHDGRLSKVEQTANGTQQTVADQQGQINTIKTDADGIHQTLTGQGNQIATINTTLDGLNSKYEGVSGDLGKLKNQAQWVTITSAVDLNSIKTPCHEFLQGTATNVPNESAWWYLTVESSDDSSRVTQTVIADQSNNRYTRRWNGEWSAWVKDATQTDITALSDRVTTNSTQIDQNKKSIALKADQSTVDNLSGEVSQNTAQLKVQADQISSKISSEDFSALSDKAMQNHGTVSGPDFNTLTQAGYYTVTNTSSGENYPIGSWGTLEVSGQAVDGNGRLNQKYVGDNDSGTYTRQYNAGTKVWTAWIKDANQNDIDTLNGMISKNSTAIDQNSKQISLKADQTEVDSVKNTATNNSSQLSTMANEIQSKVTSTDVNNIVDGKGFITQQVAQSLIDQKADTITESITGLSQKVDNNNQATVDKIQQITASIDGVQSIVKDKADQSQVTQLANALQIKMTGATIANASDVTLTYTGKDNEYPPVAAIVGMNDVDKGSTLILSFDYVASDDTKLTPQLDGTPWIPWGPIANATDVKKGEKGTYHAEITVNDDSWQNGDAKNVCIRCDGFKGTIEITNLVLKYADTVHDVQSTFDMLRDDINLRVTKGDLLSQINIAAGHTLIQSDKIYLDADSVVFGENSTAFIPSAYITDINADKITSGTLDASQIRVINLTADNIQGGTLDVGNMDVKNFSANDISAGTLSGVTVKVGDNNSFFQTSGDSIIWKKEDSWSSSSVIGTSEYAEDTKNLGLIIADSDHVQISTWPGAYVENGKIIQQGGYMGHPRIMVEKDGMHWDPDKGSYSAINNASDDASRVLNWVDTSEYFWVTEGKGALVHLNESLPDSQFCIQKNDKMSAYFGTGDEGDRTEITSFGGFYLMNTGIYAEDPNVTSTISNLVVNNLHVKNWLGVDGRKNSIVKTSQGTVAINAYETAEYYFGDLGTGNTNSQKKAVIGIEKLFNETVNTDIEYQVFVTPYSNARVWVSDRQSDHFVVESDVPNARFGYEIKAKRKGYENTRLTNVDNEVNNMKVTSNS